MGKFALISLTLACSDSAEAHLGSENNTEVRIYADKMRVVVRTSIPFAWTLIRGRAPAMADEAGQAIARPLLIEVAPSLITVTAGGNTLTPTQVDCLFEVENDVAFIFNYPRPTEWPVVVKAEFFNQDGNLETGSIAVFDYTASRFSRDLEPIAQQVIDQGNPSLSFTLGVPALPSPPAVPVTAAEARPKSSRNTLAYLILALAAGLVGTLTLRRLRGLPKAP